MLYVSRISLTTAIFIHSIISRGINHSANIKLHARTPPGGGNGRSQKGGANRPLFQNGTGKAVQKYQMYHRSALWEGALHCAGSEECRKTSQDG